MMKDAEAHAAEDEKLREKIDLKPSGFDDIPNREVFI